MGTKWTSERKVKRSQDIRAGVISTPFKHQGDDVGYEAKHKFIRQSLGKADHCSIDSTHTNRRFEWANLDHKYSRDAEDYVQLCMQCHRGYDRDLLKIAGLNLSDRGGSPIILRGNKWRSPKPMRNERR